MITWQRIQSTLAAVACLGMLTPAAVLHAEQPQTKIKDVALSAGGMLVGKVVDAAGKPVADAHLKILADERVLVNTHAAADGSFRIQSLRGGVYDLNANGNSNFMRLWANQTAPPSSSDVATLHIDGEVIRGQSCTNGSCTSPGGCDCDECVGGAFGAFGGAPMAFLMNPIVIGAIVAAAVAIPLALDDEGDDNPDAS